MPPPPNPTPPNNEDNEAFNRAEKAIQAAQAALDRASVSSPEIPANLKSTGTERATSNSTPKQTTTSSMSMAYGLAFELGVYLLVCTGAGWLIDTYLVGTGGQTWTVAGAVFGLIGGMVRTIRGAQAMYRAMDGPTKPGTKPSANAPSDPPSPHDRQPGQK